MSVVLNTLYYVLKCEKEKHHVNITLKLNMIKIQPVCRQKIIKMGKNNRKDTIMYIKQVF